MKNQAYRVISLCLSFMLFFVSGTSMKGDERNQEGNNKQETRIQQKKAQINKIDADITVSDDVIKKGLSHILLDTTITSHEN